MSASARTITLFLQVAGGLLLLALLGWLPVELGLPSVFLFFGGDLLLNGWAVYAFLRARQARQDDFARLLAAAVTAGVPLAAAVRAFGSEYPQPGPGRRLLGGLGCVLLPLYTYVRLCVGWRRYDRLLAELAGRLEGGEGLAEALRKVPGVAAREVRLAAAVGEATGELGACLRGADREQWSSGWLEVAPRFLYPLFVLFIVSGVTTFLMVSIAPKIRRIFADFGEHLPATTTALMRAWDGSDEFLPFTPVGALILLVATAAVVANPTARWYTPVLGRFYRWGLQAEVLRTLGRLLAVGKTAPQALGFLAAADDLPRVVCGRLAAATARVEGGDPLDDALVRAGLLPSSMGALVSTAGRTNTLPWALGELGDHLAGRAFRLARRVSLVVGPLLVVAVGALVALVTVGMFLPLVYLMTRLVA